MPDLAYALRAQRCHAPPALPCRTTPDRSSLNPAAPAYPGRSCLAMPFLDAPRLDKPHQVMPKLLLHGYSDYEALVISQRARLTRADVDSVPRSVADPQTRVQVTAVA